MDWFMHHAVLLGLVCAGVAVAYGVYLTVWLLKQPSGNERMREIAQAIRKVLRHICGASTRRSRAWPSCRSC